MVASTRLIKQVYASPYKTRMDVKHSPTNACSFPLIHYTVNDYTSKELHITVKQDEYLCVELAIVVEQEMDDSIDHLNKSTERRTNTITNSDAIDIDLGLLAKLNVDTSVGDLDRSSPSPVDLMSAISTEEDTSPFPTPTHHSKITLFKGAVKFSALLEVVQQKSFGYKSWLGSNEDTEFIVMRGPDGKGQCQVSVNQTGLYGGIGRSGSEGSFGSGEGFDRSLASGLRNLGNVFGRREERVGELECSMTYVNVRWQSIVM